MSDMIERVARAMATADGKDPDAPAWMRYPGGAPEGTCWRDQYAAKARAAIEAMREPTEAMQNAIDPLFSKHNRGDLPYGREARDYWQAMIDNALS